MRRFTFKLGLTLKQELNRNFKNGDYHGRRSTHFLFSYSYFTRPPSVICYLQIQTSRLGEPSYDVE